MEGYSGLVYAVSECDIVGGSLQIRSEDKHELGVGGVVRLFDQRSALLLFWAPSLSGRHARATATFHGHELTNQHQHFTIPYGVLVTAKRPR